MYLQSLEMLGFKSFASRTILNFHRGVTAVVGPNGCGKSNVLDAMRWVLGEQSAKALRGGEMADVIFSGTDSRQPLGMAEVSLRFAECEKELGVDWNEVCITRRVYRDGKSEYFLNKTPCRLKDIHNLFMDTGVGRSAYSIMEQGKIDQILSSRPEDRRAIFEEAAGITKYKAQKKEALRKLEYTEANLIRVQDIIKEVKRQIGSLQRQAAKARRYQGLMQDLRTFDTHLSHKNYLAYSADLTRMRDELAQGEEAKSVHESEIAQQEFELSDYRVRIEGLDSEASQIRDTVQNLRNRVFSAENRISTNAERVEEARGMIDRHQADIALADEKLRQQQLQIEETDYQLTQMIDTMRGHEELLSEQNARVAGTREERTSVEREVQQLSSEIVRFEAKLGTFRAEMTSALARREAGDSRLRLLGSDADAASASAAEVSLRLEQTARQLESAQSELESAQAELAAAQHAFETAQRSRQDSENALNSISKEAAGIESRLEILRQLQEQGEGFDEGTQAVLRGLDNPDFFRPAVLGTLADHIQVEPRYIPAIEAALGGALQVILFKDPSMAESAIATLNGKQMGRAAVIPRDWLVQSFQTDAFLPEGSIVKAEHCISGEGEGRQLAQSLLAGIAIVENLETAFRLKSMNPGWGFATLGGEFISKDGIVRGGRGGGGNAHSSALLRKSQIADLDRELASAIAQVESCMITRTQALEDMENSQERLRLARESVQSAHVYAASLQNERVHAERQLADVEARRAAFAREASHIEESLRASVEQVGSLEAGLAEAQQALEACQASRGEAEQRIFAARERESAAVEELNEIRVRVATERQHQENLNRQRGPMAARLSELAELVESRRVDISNYESRIGSLEAESAELSNSIGSWQEECSEQESRIAGVLSARAEVHDQSQAVEMALRSARQQLVGLQEQRGRLEVRCTQVEMRMEAVRSHVSQRYQTDLESFEPDGYGLISAFRERTKKRASGSDESTPEASAAAEQGADFVPQAAAEVVEEVQEISVPDQSEGIPWDQIEEIVAELTERVDSMGPVNLDAIQEYDELEQRYLFLEQQNADLTKSKADLLDVISKINRTTRELFADTFYKIRDNFQVMFTELFGGGRANLMLVDESDPLESGIEIIAKPPGKQLQSISLLSGGERTMTAVSLLFAIYMVKPSPFCVLDEMDAPLDESNISRFIKILDKFVSQSQFVVITHNKRTISRADMLYGVTMEEHGVSKTVSVKFSGKAENPDGQVQSVAEAFGKHGDLESEREALVEP
jgi:chromosome segregation protein